MPDLWRDRHLRWREYRDLSPRRPIEELLDPADWLAHACSIVKRDLTRTEWAVYLPGRPYRPTCSG